MHELSVVKALADGVKTHCEGQDLEQIKVITIEVGKLTCVDPERLQFCFDMIRQEVGLEQAKLNINKVPAIACCQQCSTQYEIENPGQACRCGCYEYRLETGNELNLIQIEFN